MTLADLEVTMRRHMEAGDYDAAAEVAIEIDRFRGEPIEDDRVPEPIPCWGTDAE